MLLAGTAHEAAFRIDRGMAKVLELARNGDEAILLLLSGVGEALGFAIANLITLFAPPKVILVGAAMEAQRALMGPVQRTIAMLVPASLADVAEIVVHHWNDEMWARGGAAMALRDLYGAPWNTTGPAVRTASLENRRRSLSILTLGEQDA